jgi:hypothetical protein
MAIVSGLPECLALQGTMVRVEGGFGGTVYYVLPLAYLSAFRPSQVGSSDAEGPQVKSATQLLQRNAPRLG